MRDQNDDPANSGPKQDPVRQSQEAMRTQLPKRFYDKAEVAEVEGRFAIRLDGKPVRTPGRNLLSFANAPLAERAAAEWLAQEKHIDPVTMPLTRLANTAIDGVASEMQAVAEDVLRFAGTDLICYRAGEPERLVAMQAEYWDPLVDWAHFQLGAQLVLAEGVMHVAQPREAINAISIHLRNFTDPMQLAGLHLATTLTGSAIIALAVAAGEISPEDAWTAAHIDEDWNIAQWGEDAEAAARRAFRWRDMLAACAVFECERETN